jgi:hypothetical protein
MAEVLRVSGYDRGPLQVHLRDGSRLSVIPSQGQFNFFATDGRRGQLPWADIAVLSRLGYDAQTESTALLHVTTAGGDRISGSPRGPLVIETRFGPQALEWATLDQVELGDDPTLSIRFADGAVISGRLDRPLHVNTPWAGDLRFAGTALTKLVLNRDQGAGGSETELILRSRVADLGSADAETVATAGAWLATHRARHQAQLIELLEQDELPEIVRRRLAMILGREP